MPINSYALIAGYSGTPVNVESIAVTGGEDLRPFYSKLTAATYYMVATDSPYTKPYLKAAAGTWTQSGYAAFTWKFPMMGVTSYKYLLSTYAQDNVTYRGKVTVGARSLEYDVYDDLNCDMYLDPVPADAVYCRNGVFYFQNITARFIVKGAA